MASIKDLNKTRIHDRFIVLNPSWRCHMAIPNQDLKRCSKCGEEKPYEEFYKQHAFTASCKRTAVMSECKVCTRLRTRTRKYGEKYQQLLEQDRISGRARTARAREKAFAAYGGYKCVCCGETEPMFMSLDHIENDGADFRRKIKGKRTTAGYPTYKWLADNGFPKIVQVLCMNCNFGKRMNKGICPHQVRRNDQSKDVDSSESKRTTSQPIATRRMLTLMALKILKRDDDMVCSA